VHYGRHNPTSLAAATANGYADPTNGFGGTAVLTAPEQDEQEENEGPGRIVREKSHPATPMSIDQALFEMELVGHDFYLFHDSSVDRPSVVYRRHAYDYGVIRLGE
jgi:hypothetical protein